MAKWKKKERIRAFSRRQKKLLTWWLPSSPHNEKHIVAVSGAVRSGKTVAAIESFLLWSLSTFENASFVIAGKTISSLRRNVLWPMFDSLEDKGIPFEYKRSTSEVLIGSNTYYCFGANTEASQDTLQGLTSYGSLLDEAVLMPRNFVEQNFARASKEGARHFLTMNPGSPRHYLKEEYLDKAEDKNLLVISFTLEDNPSLSEEVKERLRKSFSGVFYRRFIQGHWALADGLVYQSFDESTMVVEKPPEDVKRAYIGIDYGTQNATVFLLIGVGDSGTLYVLDEYFHSGKKSKQKSPSQYSIDFQEFLKKHQKDYTIKRTYIDPAATHFITQLYQDKIKGIAKAKNDVIPGISAVSNLIAEDKLRVLKHCTNTIKELQTYSWDDKAPYDRPLKTSDHTCDALRYVVYTQKI